MKIGVITTTNTKGQLVIPKKYRDKLNISEGVHLNIILDDEGIHIYPIETVQNSTVNRKELYRAILKRVKGSWASDTRYEKDEKKRHLMELAASKRNQNAW